MKKELAIHDLLVKDPERFDDRDRNYNLTDIAYFFPENKDEGIMVYVYNGVDNENNEFIMSSSFEDVKRDDRVPKFNKAVRVQLVDGARMVRTFILSRNEMINLLNMLKKAKLEGRTKINYKVKEEINKYNEVNGLSGSYKKR